ncbi:MAG: class I SAM-dependent methyltransferase [Verrucomicrobiota bacterium]|nr:class I SAM-dependent methyltransferase [Verrucomicrobiota bacterium]
MEDTLLHPFDAFGAWQKYHALKTELEGVVRREFAGDSADVSVHEAFSGKMNFPDAYVLARLLRRYRPTRILEVGSFVGFSTRWILETATAWGGSVTSVDPNIRHRSFDAPGEVLKRLNERFLPDRLDVVHGFFGTPGDVYHDYEQHEPKRSREFVDQLVASRERIGEDWERRFEFIFIDGDHTYEAVTENFRIARHLLAAGGCIAFHDAISWPGVNQALREIAQAYRGKAETRIFGKLDHALFQGMLRKHTDGIGFFRPA